MKSTWPITSAVIITLGISSLAVYGIALYSTTKSQQRIADLQAATNCQIDIVASFIQTYKLAHVRPNAAQNFEDYLTSQVKAGLVPEAVAKEALASIKTFGQGHPVYTTRGWVMPILATGNQP